MKNALLNAILGIFWLLLSPNPNLFQLMVGMFLGFWIIYLFRNLIGAEIYVKRVFAFHRFLGTFLKIFIKSNLNVAKIVLLNQQNNLNPGFVHYSLEGLTDFEIILLSHCISLTPGTTSTEIDPDKTVLTIHALESSSPDAIIAEIDQTLKNRILAFSRT